YVPQKSVRRSAPPASENGSARPAAPPGGDAVILQTPRLGNEGGDDRGFVNPRDPLLLIVENDRAFPQLLLETAHEKGVKGFDTQLGAGALAMRREYKPDAITLDICLPDIDGWRVIDRLKNDMYTRHIPVCIISTEEAHNRALTYGAFSVLSKPIKSR